MARKKSKARKKAGGGKKKWIQKAIKKPGALRAQLGVKGGETIPAAKLEAAAKKKGKLGQRARMAQTLRKLGKKKAAPTRKRTTPKRRASSAKRGRSKAARRK